MVFFLSNALTGKIQKQIAFYLSYALQFPMLRLEHNWSKNISYQALNCLTATCFCHFFFVSEKDKA